MKRVLSILMLTSLLLQSTSMLWTVGGFYLNRDYIAKNLCVNRDKPRSGCNGACQLMKKLKKDQEDSERSGTELKQKELNLFVALPLGVHTSPALIPVESRPFNSRYTALTAQEFIASVFHPPAAA